MRQPVSRRVFRFFPILYCALALLLPAPARGQEDEPSVESMAEPPADAVMLSLQDVLDAALEHNLDIAVRRYDPLRSATAISINESIFDPTITGDATSLQDENISNQVISAAEFSFPSTSKNHIYGIRFRDPLVIGGNYELEVSASDTLFRGVFFDFTTFSTIPFETQQFDSSWNVSFNQPLLRNLGPNVNRWQIIVSRNDLEVSEEMFRQTVIDTLSGAEKTYWDLNLALMELETQNSALRLAEEFLEQNKIKVRVGTLAPIEITQAEADVADREEKVIVAEHLVLQREDELRQVMNIPRDSPWWMRPIRPADAPPLVEVTLDLEQEVAEAAKNRPDLSQARTNIRSREFELKARRNLRRWGLDFEGKFGREGVSGILLDRNYSGAFDNLRDNSQEDWNLKLLLSVPIGNREAIARYVDAEHRLHQAQFELQRLEQAGLIEVRNAVRTVLTNRKRVDATRASTRLQTEKLEAEQKKFENGMSTSFQVLTFQNDLTAARSRENLAITDYNKSLVELDRVKGTLLEARRIFIPSVDGGGSSGSAAALRTPWRRRAADFGKIAADFSSETNDTIALPTSFVYRGDGIVGIGGTIEIGEESTAGR